MNAVEIKDLYKSYEDGKIVVIEVFQDSPSERAGLKVGDKIVGLDGKKINF